MVFSASSRIATTTQVLEDFISNIFTDHAGVTLSPALHGKDLFKSSFTCKKDTFADEVVGLLVDKRIRSFRLTMNFQPATRFATDFIVEVTTASDHTFISDASFGWATVGATYKSAPTPKKNKKNKSQHQKSSKKTNSPTVSPPSVPVLEAPVDSAVPVVGGAVPVVDVAVPVVDAPPSTSSVTEIATTVSHPPLPGKSPTSFSFTEIS